MHPFGTSYKNTLILAFEADSAASLNCIFFQILTHYVITYLFSRSLLERVELVNIRWELWEISVLLLAFAIAQFAFYSCLPYLLKMTSATALNLNLLATDYYTIVAGIVFFNYKVCT